MTREKVHIFEENWKLYDNWFERHQAIFQSEIKALKKIIPSSGLGLEIGAGTGRFASSFSVKYGLDPSFNMLKLAKERNIQVVQGVGEVLPFKNESFNFVLIVVTICFVDYPLKVLKETFRTLKKKGVLILGIIEKESKWGRFYEAKATRSKFYKTAHFFSSEEILRFFKNIRGKYKEAYQTLFQSPPDIREIEKPRKGFGQGGFVVFKVIKK